MTEAPVSAFATEFRRLAVPKLAPVCEVHALFMALEMETYSEAVAEVMGAALDNNAGFLPKHHFEQLEEWAGDTILARALVKQDAIDRENAAMAHVHADVERWNAEVIALHG